jgi:diguanylate cyclase (GGDEF)-like protein
MTMLKNLEFLKEKTLSRRFYAIVVGTFVCSACLFLIYAQILQPPQDEIIRGFIVTIFMTPLITIPFTIYAMDLNHQLCRTRNDLAQLVREDPLTKLLNRRGFYERISVNDNLEFHDKFVLQPVETVQIQHGALLILDVDNFKNINDTYGHDVGDEVLIGLAQVISKSIRDGDTAARIGGEEFAVFINGADVHDIAAVFERIKARLSEIPIYSAEENIYISVSCGAVLASTGMSFNAIYKAADEMLYKAKNSGKNCMFLNKDKVSLGVINNDQFVNQAAS